MKREYTRRREPLGVYDIVAEYLLFVRSRFSLKTYQRAEYSLKKLLAYCDTSGIQRITQLDRHRLRLFAAALKDADYSPETVWGVCSTVKTMLRWCVAEGILDEVPIQPGDMPSKPAPKPDPLTEEELSRVLKACDEPGWIGLRNYALVYTLAWTGMRRGELLQMRISDVDRGYAIVIGKGDQQRRVPLGTDVREHISRYLRRFRLERGLKLDPDDPLWWSRYTEPMSENALRLTLHRIGKRAGVHLYAHRLRDTCATLRLAKGGSTELVRTILGHRDMRSIKAYVQLSDEDVQRLAEESNPLRDIGKRRRR